MFLARPNRSWYTREHFRNIAKNLGFTASYSVNFSILMIFRQVGMRVDAKSFYAVVLGLRAS